MKSAEVVEAAGGLALHLTATPHWRIAWGEADWLGPVGFLIDLPTLQYRAGGATPSEAPTAFLQPTLASFDGHDDLGGYRGVSLDWDPSPLPLRMSVRAYGALPLIVFRVEAHAPIAGIATGHFTRPSVAWPTLLPAHRVLGGVPEGTRSYGHQYTEFALPVTGDADCTGFMFAPHRPAIVEPLMFIAPDGRTLLLAPLNQFHDQIIAVAQDDGGGCVRCGWHGDLAGVAAGFATELALWGADRPRAALTEWAEHLRRQAGTQRPSRYADTLLAKLSYWTDNGAVYYYRTEEGCDYPTTLARVTADLQANHVPVRSLQIDSWFYPHQHLRPVGAAGAPIVPPSGMVKWEPREDLFPQGFGDLREWVANLPLTFHSRHFSSQAPYFAHYAAWRDGDYAHPADAELYDMLMAQAAAWGAITYEQDWLVESFLGVRGLREYPGRARVWQEQLDGAAAEHGLNLQWCMATPADFMQTVTLRRVASIRTSGDYRYLFDNGLNWFWFLHTNALARAFGLNPFKDVFLSHGQTALSAGEPYAEIEALLASLSSGPVAIGDQIGCTNRDLVMRCCREDGVLIKPDVPLAAIDRCFRSNGFFEPALVIAETVSTHPAGTWVYVVCVNGSRAETTLRERIALSDLGTVRPIGSVLAYDWRRGSWQRVDVDDGWEVMLPFHDWDYRILCPLLPGDITVFGDLRKYATVGDRRIAHIMHTSGTLRFVVRDAPGAWVDVHGYAAERPAAVTISATPCPLIDHDASPESGWSWDASTGRWIVHVHIGPLGHADVVLFSHRRGP